MDDPYAKWRSSTEECMLEVNKERQSAAAWPELLECVKQLCKECKEHNAEYQHVTPAHLIQRAEDLIHRVENPEVPKITDGLLFERREVK